MGLAALWIINTFVQQIRKSEEEKVRIWASAISQKAELMTSTETFFNEVAIDERRKVKLYIDVLQSFNNKDLGSDAEFYLSYVSYIVDSSRTPFMIINRDSVITSCGNIKPTIQEDGQLIGTKVTDEMLQNFSDNPPFHYSVWGIPLTLIYRESQIYSDMRATLDNLNRSFLSEVTNNSVFVPVIVVDSSKQNILGSGNINPHDFDTPQKLSNKLRLMANENQPITLQLANNQTAFVYYEPTPMLKLLRIIPLIYLFLALVLLLVSYNLFRTARSEEENRVWVGMAKETAHQLGTPISSLMAWTQILRDTYPQDPMIPEMETDVERLQLVADRFSKIGSRPELKRGRLADVVRTTADYMRRRAPEQVKVSLRIEHEAAEAEAMLCAPLYQWVLENLCRNAIDAIPNGIGRLSISLAVREGRALILVSDTGKGIPRKDFKNVFRPGFTTKKRGWGLGLSLAKRIIEEYHSGRIYVRDSQPGHGTTFAIETDIL